jgi:hypothetical protein
MPSVVDKVQEAIKKTDDSNDQFYREYKIFDSMYKELLNKGVVSKRQSQLLSITDKATTDSIHFSNSEWA